MSLLLDALKKAADDKKKSVDDSTDGSPAQDNSNANSDDSLELELDEQQNIENDAADDNDFPRVEQQAIVSHSQQLPSATDDRAAAETGSQNTLEHSTDASEDNNAHDAGSKAGTDTADTQQPAELELSAIQTAKTEVTDKPDESRPEPQAEDAKSTASGSTHTAADTGSVSQPEDQAAETEVPSSHSKVIGKTDRAVHNTDNEAALSALINKSNQYQQQAQKKRMILLVILILLLISGSALFFYLKAEMASHDLYIAQNSSSPLPREPAVVNNRSQSAAGRQTATTADGDSRSLTLNPAHTTETASHSHSSEQPVSKPASTQSIKAEQSVQAGKTSNKPAEPAIHIQQSSREDPVEALVMDAYNAFQRGNYDQAEKLYQQVLVHEPRNRDASLGLAAIALKQQRYEFARQKYRALLQLNPKDSLAIAGLSSVNQSTVEQLSDNGLSESQLKFMLKEQPDAAHLYFALGTLYAGKNQWPQAQSAYFSAWSGDSTNADYAFNLAVSLDHINQPQQALQYYQLSLRLMRNNAANFSASQVQQRINSLQEAMR